MPVYPKSIRHVFVFLMLAFLAIALRLAWIQVIRGDELAHHPYEDRQLLQAAERLIQGNGVLREGVLGRIERTRLSDLVPQRWLQERLLHLDDMGLFQVVDDQIVLADHSVLIRNPRLRERRGPRGRILDRHGVVLAEEGSAGGRRYPLGEAAFHAVGFDTTIYGSMGLEALWQRGQEGDLATTLDAVLQRRAFELMRSERPEISGAAILLDVKTGDILALVSLPTFDPNQKPGRTWVAHARDNENQPFLNRAIQAIYPPGSTFKLIVAATALQTPGFNPGETLVCQGQLHRIRDHEPHGVVDLARALSVSCNSYFGHLGVILGTESIRQIARAFGFETSWNIAPGIASEPSTVPQEPIPYRGLRAQIGIGQYEVRATPLQMAVVAQVIANDGLLVPPRLISDGTVPPSKCVLPAETAHRLQAMMQQVMQEGTGVWVPRIYRTDTKEGVHYQVAYRNAEAEWIQVAGKTGTAETGREGERPHSWFIGFAPLSSPRYAVSVLVEHGGWGSTGAAPIAVQLLAAALAGSEEGAVLLAANLPKPNP